MKSTRKVFTPDPARLTNIVVAPPMPAKPLTIPSRPFSLKVALLQERSHIIRELADCQVRLAQNDIALAEAEATRQHQDHLTNNFPVQQAAAVETVRIPPGCVSCNGREMTWHEERQYFYCLHCGTTR